MQPGAKFPWETLDYATQAKHNKQAKQQPACVKSPLFARAQSKSANDKDRGDGSSPAHAIEIASSDDESNSDESEVDAPGSSSAAPINDPYGLNDLFASWEPMPQSVGADNSR